MNTKTSIRSIDQPLGTSALKRGQQIRFQHETEGPVTGVLDMCTDDGSIMWVFLSDGRGRRLIHREDGYQLDTPKNLR